MKDEVIGYRRTSKTNWDPIYPPKPGMIYTAAIMSCSDCGKTISASGGPGHNCVCPTCFDKFKLINFTVGGDPV